MTEVLVLGEANGNRLESVTTEMLAAARELGSVVGIALLGDKMGDVAPEAFSHGADIVYMVQDSILLEKSVDFSLAAFEQICKEALPSVVLVGKTIYGCDIAPRLAARLGVGMAQDCTSVLQDSCTGRLVATRPVYGGNALATLTFSENDPQVVVIRNGAYEPLAPDPSRNGEVVLVSGGLDSISTKVRHVETVIGQHEGTRMEDASVIVAGGRGIGGPEAFNMLNELAQLLDGAIGASRAVCDAGWLNHSFQIGLTGKMVNPDLYIAVGISGASQHMVGCLGAKHIVAVNRDADANIFRDASYGVVGDWKEVLPAFVERVRELIEKREV